MYDKIIIVAYKKNSRHLGHGPLKHRVIQNILACNKFKICAHVRSKKKSIKMQYCFDKLLIP
jgi:hypothetical protein